MKDSVKLSLAKSEERPGQESDRLTEKESNEEEMACGEFCSLTSC